MTEAVSLESLAAELARVHARLDARSRLDVELLAGPETPEERRAAFTVVAGSVRRRTPRRGRLRAVSG